ncbi:MAG: VWA domain-containing protein [Gemmatimonadales bacterium]|jgi:Ca-activated chloride channel family protein
MKTLATLLVTAILAGPALAQGWIEPFPGRPGPFGVVRERTAISVRITGRVAHVEVEEWFRNTGGGLGEGDYLYPLPGEAVFSNYSLFQGDQELRGETMDAAQARQIYEEIVRRRRDPALIELVGQGLVRARVFPINPGETRKITLRFTQMLDRTGDALQYRYAAGGRFSHGPRPGESPSRLQPEREPGPVTLTLVADEADRFGDPFSPTHELRVDRDHGRLTVRPEGDVRGDLSLILPLERPVVGISLVTHRPAGENGYFMLTLSPGRADGGTLPRDVTVVLDVSGSMSGSKLRQAKAALRQLLASLGGRDRFRLLAFSNSVRALTTDWAEHAPDDLDRARAWIAALGADGGTNIAGALAEAFRLESPEERVPIVVFLTDGLPSVGERDPERIAEQAEQDRGRHRVFAFGVGHDVNTYLLDRLSAVGRGATEYVEPGEDVERALGLLAAKVQHPVLADLAIVDAPVALTEVYPGTLPDLFQGEELVVFGRYRYPGARERGDMETGRIVISGRRSGRTERFTTDVAFPEHELANDYIPRLWASRKIGVLSREIRLGGHNPELEQEIRETALRYGLLSEYTSYLVQEPTQVAGVTQPVALDQAVRAAPQAASGAGAVQFAERERLRREARSQVALDAAEEALVARTDFGQARHVAGRLFRAIDGVWTDLRPTNDSARTVAIRPFSAAYFELLDALPELKAYVAEFAQVAVSGRAVTVRIVDDGSEEIEPRELSRLVREFRAR